MKIHLMQCFPILNDAILADVSDKLLTSMCYDNGWKNSNHHAHISVDFQATKKYQQISHIF